MGGRNSAAKIGKKTIKLLALTKRSWLTCDNLLILSQSNQKTAKRTCAPGPAHSRLKTRFRLKMHEMFLSTLRRRDGKTQQTQTIVDSFLKKTRAKKSHYYRDVIVFAKLCFSWLVWTVCPTVNITQRFHISPAQCWQGLGLLYHSR